MRIEFPGSLTLENLGAFTAVVNALPVVAYLSDANGVVTFVSRGWERFTGNASDTLEGRGLEALIHPDERTRFLSARDAARIAGESFGVQARLRFGDGSYRWVATQADPIRGADGEFAGWCGLVRDINEWRLAEEAMSAAFVAASERADSLARSEERWRLLSESLPGTTWTATPDGLLDHVSDGQWTENRLSVAPLLGEGWLDALHPDDRDRARARWARSVRSGEPYEIQFRVLRTTGEYGWQLVRALAQRDGGGEIIRWVGVNVDIDEQRKADEAREKFVALIENSGDIIAMTDREGVLTYANPAARRLLALDDIASLLLFDCFSPQDREFVRSVVVPAIERDGRWVGEMHMRNFRTRATFPILFNAFSLTDASGESMGLATISRDLRGRQRIDIGMRALAEAGAVMYRSLDYEETLRNIAEAVARTFATFCSIDVVDGDGMFRRVAVAHPHAEMREFLKHYTDRAGFASDHPIALAIRSGAPTCIGDLDLDRATKRHPQWRSYLETLRVRSFISVPVRAPDGAIFGALTCCLDADDANPSYTVDDLPFAEELGRRAGIAVEHARAYEREHAIAVRFQEASLPGVLPAVPGLTLSADYRPGNSEATIGGDWFDAFVLDDGRLVVTIGDVLGKGLDAAVTMAKLRQAMRSAAALHPEPLAMLTAAESAVRDVATTTYATALAAIYDPCKRELICSSAGHAGPTILRADGTIVDYAPEGMMLGLRQTESSERLTLAVEKGSTLVFFTDGLTESTHDLDEGYRRLHAALAVPPAPTMTNRARALVDHVLGGSSATDDIAVLVAHIDGAPLLETWRVPARPEEVATVRRAIQKASQVLRDDTRALIELAAGEVVSNAVKYGRGSFVDVTLSIGDDCAVLSVGNEGTPFERREIDLRSVGLAESGRGLALLSDLGFELLVAGEEGRCTVSASLKLR